MCDSHRKLDMPEWTEQIRLAGKATLRNVLRPGRSEVLRSLRHYLRAQIQGHHTIDHLVERGVERGSARRSSLTGLGFSERIDPSCTELNSLEDAMLGVLRSYWDTNSTVMEIQ